MSEMNALEKMYFGLLCAVSHYDDVNRDGLKNTPQRCARAFSEMFRGYADEKNIREIMTMFDSEGSDQMVVLRDIEFYSTCEHHMLPFFGKAHIGYLPGKKIVGISKLARVLDIYSRRLQNQERITSQVAEILTKYLKPKGVAVVLEAEHLCMRARGVQKQNSVMMTSKLTGGFSTNDRTRLEFFSLIGK